MSNFANRLSELLESKDLSKKYVAERLNVSADLVSKWCSENPKYRRDPNTEHLSKLADLLDVSTDYLLCRTNVPYNRTEQDIINSIGQTEADELIKKHGITIDEKRYTMQEVRAIFNALKGLHEINDILNVKPQK